MNSRSVESLWTTASNDPGLARGAVRPRRPHSSRLTQPRREKQRHYQGVHDDPYFVLRFRCVEIRDSARKHGIDDEEIEHAVVHALVVAELDGDKTLYLGPDRASNLLEVVAVTRMNQAPLVIHAMAMRRQYEPYLRGQEDTDG